MLVTVDVPDELYKELEEMVDEDDPEVATVELLIVDIIGFHLSEPDERDREPTEAELEAGEDATPETKEDAETE